MAVAVKGVVDEEEKEILILDYENNLLKHLIQ